MTSWIEPYLHGRQVMFDPGTFSRGAVSYLDYRRFIEDYQPSLYLQYDEIGDPEATAWYLSDMRRRDFAPIPIMQPGADPTMLDTEPKLALGGLAVMSKPKRQEYLDSLFYPNGELRKVGWVHLLGISPEQWFERYPASSGDSTTWLPRNKWNRHKSLDEWVQWYGERDIPFIGQEARVRGGSGV